LRHGGKADRWLILLTSSKGAQRRDEAGRTRQIIPPTRPNSPRPSYQLGVVTIEINPPMQVHTTGSNPGLSYPIQMGTWHSTNLPGIEIRGLEAKRAPINLSYPVPDERQIYKSKLPIFVLCDITRHIGS
jgi:hypothetical protein